MRGIFAILFSFAFHFLFSQEGLTSVRKFGSNPGDLRMYYHVPSPLVKKAPLVVVLHGCTESAEGCAQLTGWNKFADENGFFVLYPEQKMLNNGQTCFNWFTAGDQSSGKGEPGSVMEMIAYMKANFEIDSTKIFVSGLSAGAAMGAVLMAVYPDVFNAGALFAGGPYKSAENLFESVDAMKGRPEKTPQQWGDLVRAQNPAYKGSYPRLMIVQGKADSVVSPRNANLLIAQWTNLHDCDQNADFADLYYRNNSRISCFEYCDAKKETAVRCFYVKDMGHAVPLDTGVCACKGGQTGLWGKQVGFNGVYEAVLFFGIAKPGFHCIECVPPIPIGDILFSPLVNHSANPALPDSMQVVGTVVEISPGYCGVYCTGGTIKVKLEQTIPGYSDSYVYLITACLSTDIKAGAKVDVFATAYYGTETECYYQGVNNQSDSHGMPFYKLSERETAKIH